jgi:4-carboxymuconolactone decarboxylase
VSKGAKTAKYEKGLAVRRAVLGDAYVDRALAPEDEFSQTLQDWVTEQAWGEVWVDDTLPRKTRSMLNIALLATLNRPHELKLHLRGALTNGASRKEIAAVLIHCGVYCGAPVAVDSFRIAREVFAELDKA